MVDGPDTAAWVEAQNDPPGDQTAWYFANDFQEQQKFQQFYPTGQTWWEGLAQYGVTRAIDSHFSTVGVNKTNTGATYAGQNGQTYPNGAAVGNGGGLVPLLLIAAVAFVALN